MKQKIPNYKQIPYEAMNSLSQNVRDSAADYYLSYYNSLQPNPYEYHVSGYFMDGFKMGYIEAQKEIKNQIQLELAKQAPPKPARWLASFWVWLDKL